MIDRSSKSPRPLVEPLESRTLFTVISVLNLGDSGADTLRAALAAASDGDTIDLTGRSGTLTLTSGEIAVSHSVTILGPGAGVLTISGNNSSRVFNVTSGKTVEVDDLTLTAGHTGGDGGTIRNSGNLTLDHVRVTNSVAGQDGGALSLANGSSTTLTDCSFVNNSIAGGWTGGAISTFTATLTVIRCTFDGNHINASGGNASGGAIYLTSSSAEITDSTFIENTATGSPSIGFGPGDGFGGAIQSDDTSLSITNCTITGNTAAGGSGGGSANGGGIFVSAGDVSVVNCTIVGNAATGASEIGGGLSAHDSIVTVANTILAGNTAAGSPDHFLDLNSYTGCGNNLIGDGTTSGSDAFVTGVGGYMVGSSGSPIDPRLAPLADNGGPTLTMMLRPDSPAIDFVGMPGITVALSVDQRGVTRDALPDLGAVEFPGAPVTGFGNEISLDGVDDYLAGPRNTALELQTFTVQAMMIVAPGAGTTNAIYSYGAHLTNEPIAIEYRTDLGGRLRLRLQSSYGVNFIDLICPLAVANVEGKWLNVAATWDGATAALYVDGQLLGSTTGSGTAGYSVSDTLAVGSWFGGERFFDGALDEVRVYDHALTAGQLAPINGILTGHESGLVGYWRMDESIGTVARDSSPTERDLTLTNVGDLAAARVPSNYAWTATTDEDTLVQTPVRGYDPNGGQFTYETVNFSHGSVFITGSTLLEFQPSANESGVTQTLTYRAVDLDGNVSNSTDIAIDITPVNDDPTFTSTAGTIAIPNATYVYSVTATDVDGDPLAITATTKPAWLTLVDNGDGTATLGGLPADGDVGANAVTLEVNDGTSSVSQSFSINVNTTPIAADLTATRTVTGDVHIDAQSAASDADGDPLTFSILTQPTNGSVIGDGSTFIYTSTPGAYHGGDRFTYQVSDGRGGVASGTVLLEPQEEAETTIQGDDDADVVVNGTNGDDVIRVRRATGRDMASVWLNGTKILDQLPGSDRLIVAGLAGNDVIRASQGLRGSYVFYGDAGNDTLIGARGSDMLFGGAGDDVLRGGGRRDLLVGGDGADMLRGGSAGDLLIGGYTEYDADDNSAAGQLAMADLFDAWKARPTRFSSRVSLLESLAGVGDDGASLISDHLIDDNATDVLRGWSNRNWFFAGADDVTRSHAGDKVTAA